ncbi:aerolysin family beta-barrel pore-forming toxin [Clostridium tarantellae]|uniref:Aerolysin family beta-barrel pore-forming toxin n=1 Tax=Clostridium tarantellae TaxID=39493 RepID=A0A6I1MKQ3_9CLOT|nr:aerolysin family beta-barrel pore-forming toxin [Clostridium tarantellae]MPQ43600.1 aerolysin family beta-barrel pore-forming toxin [Clostridium tarantellae]
MSNNVNYDDYIKIDVDAFDDLEVIKYKLCSHPLFIKKWALLANFLGYEKCGGSNTRVIGEGYTVKKSGENYIIEARNNVDEESYRTTRGNNSPYTRLNMTVSNFKFEFMPETIKTLIPIKEESPPKDFSQSYVYNNNIKEIEIKKDISFSTSDATKNFSSAKYKLGVKAGFAYKIKEVSEFHINYNFSWDINISDQKEERNTIRLDRSVKVKVPPKSKIPIKILLYKNNVAVPYTALVLISYNITLNGKINRNKNAYLGYLAPANLATSFTFGNDKISAIDDISNQIKAFDKSSFYWDWNLVKTYEGFQSVLDIISKREVNEVNGRFEKVNFSNLVWESGMSEALNETDDIISEQVSEGE